MLSPPLPRTRPQYPLFRHACRSILLLLTFSLLAGTHAAQSNGDIPLLEVGKPVKRELAGGQSHSYRIILASGQYLNIVVDQQGADVVVVLSQPDGKQLVEVDSPNGTQGPEVVSSIAETSGTYYLDVRALEKVADAGHYEVKIEELRPARKGDRSRIAAERVFLRAELLRNEGSARSLRLSVKNYEESLPLWQAAGDTGKVAATLVRVGLMYNAWGEKRKALDYFQQSLPLWRAIEDRDGEAATLVSIGAVYEDRGEGQMALSYYEPALTLWRAVTNPRSEAMTYLAIGKVYTTLGEKSKAISNYKSALELWRAVKEPDDEATVLVAIGGLYDDSGEKQKALVYYRRALRLWRAAGDRTGEATILNNIGTVYNALDNKQKAADYHKQAVSLWRTAKDRGDEATTLANIAVIERDWGNVASARNFIEEARTIVESLRAKISSQELRSSYFSTVQDYYDFYIDLLMEMHRREPSAVHDGVALQASERARARSLLELLKEVHADIRRGVDPALLQKKRSLQELLNAMAELQARLLGGRHTAARAVEVAKEIEALTLEYQSVEAKIRQLDPRYAALTQPQALSPKEMQQALDPDTLLLEYALGNRRSHLWLVSSDEVKSYELPPRGEIETAARQFYELLNRPSQTYQQQEMLETASRLSRMLLGPVTSQLGWKRLLIVADGALQYVPFAAVPDPAFLTQEAGALQPLIVRHEVVSLHSMSVLAASRSELEGRKPAPQDVAVLADPVFYPDDERVKRDGTPKESPRQDASPVEPAALMQKVEKAAKESRARRVGGRLVRLKGTQAEAEGILALVPDGKNMRAFDFDASRGDELKH